MRILALDLGDKWVGSAISDTLKITSRPYKTIKVNDLNNFLQETLANEEIECIIVGHPKTSKGTQSLQTEKTEKIKHELEKKFNQIKWILWDERLSSKRAEQLQGKIFRTKQGKLDNHSVAAAFILQSYIDSLALSETDN